MGSVFRLPVARGDLTDSVRQARSAGARILTTTVANGTPLPAAELARPLFVLVGNEGGGLPDAMTRESDINVTIAMAPNANSLNVAVSAALVLWEARRREQRS
jgi:TrmH family RNA methyltransferase